MISELEILGFPGKVQALFLVPAARIREAADTVGRAFVELDLPVLTLGQRCLAGVLQTAMACALAPGQGQALKLLDEVARAADVPPERLSGLYEVHCKLRTAGEGIRWLLSGAADGRLAVRAVRAAAQAHIRSWIETALHEGSDLPPAMRETIRAAYARVQALTPGPGAAGPAGPSPVAALLADAEADMVLCETILLLREGKVPAPEILLQATRHFRKRLLGQEE